MEKNDDIKNFLNGYINIEDTQYSVLLTGEWGCGKTFFIKQWLQEIKDDDENHIKPVYVSLYGMKHVPEIKEEINRSLSPILYSPGFSLLKKAGKIISKVALKTDITSGDDTVTANFDGLSLMEFFKKDDIGNKILVFDDFERCLIHTKELMGYINFLVEHCDCKVIILSDTTHLNKSKIFDEIKEKTIGRTFKIAPDMKGAIKSFIKDHFPLCHDSEDNKIDFIQKILQITASTNLRVLKQSLQDFRMCEYQIDGNDKSKQGYPGFIHLLLAHFIVVYQEYNKGNKQILRNIADPYYNSKRFGRDVGVVTEEKDDVDLLREKYLHLSLPEIKIFDAEITEVILNYLETGVFNYKSIQYKVSPPSKLAYQTLQNIYYISNEQYQAAYQECIELLKSNKANEQILIYTLVMVIKILDFGVQNDPSAEKIVEGTIDYILSIQNDQYKIYSIKKLFCHAFNNFQLGDGSQTLTVGIKSYFDTQVTEMLKKMPSPMAAKMENLDDESAMKFEDFLQEATPNGERAYNMMPLFDIADPHKVAQGILNLSNRARIYFRFAIDHHFGLQRSGVVMEVNDYMKADYPNLCTIKKLLEDKLPNKQLVDKINLQDFIVSLGQAIEKIKKKIV